MIISSWIRSLFGRSPHTIRKSPARFRSALESLEQRTLLTVTFDRYLDQDGNPDWSAGANPFAQVVADFDLDGFDDLAVTTTKVDRGDSAGVNVYLGESYASQASSVFHPGLPVAIAAGDFNGDNWPDLLVADIASNTVTVMLNSRAVTESNGQRFLPFQFHGNISIGNEPSALAVTDVNGDGKSDFVVTTGNNKLNVFLGNGNGTFQAGPSYSVGALPTSISIGDINSDTLPDFVVTNGDDDSVTVLLKSAHGTFQSPITVPVGDSPMSGALGDFDGDGKLDMVTANLWSNDLSVLSGNGDGTFGSSVQYTVGSEPCFVVAADLNLDGKLDLAAANRMSGNISVLLGRGNGDFAGETTVDTGDGPTSIAVLPHYKSIKYGYPALNVLNGSDSTRTVLVGAGNRYFTPASELFSDLGAPVAVDFNHDGNADLVDVGNYQDQVNVRFGNGDGSFQSPVTSSLGLLGISHGLADFNGDGTPDLVVLGASGDTIPNAVCVLLGNVDGTFAPPVAISTIQSYLFDIADFNNDGHLDIVFGQFDQNGPAVALSLGNGDGTFAPSTLLEPASGFVSSIKAGDINGDGNQDLISSVAFRSGTLPPGVYAMLGNGDGSFQSPYPIIAPAGLGSVALGDLDNDGKTDLIATHDPDVLTVRKGNGNGTFQAPVEYSTQSTVSIQTADVNGDGWLDLVVRDFRQAVIVWPGNGDGTLQPPLVQSDNHSLGLTIADFNNDGLLDLATSQGLLLNIHPAVTLTNSSIADGLPSGTTVSSINTAHPDDPENFFTYQFIGGTGSDDNGAFTLLPDGTLKTKANIDYATQSSYSIRVRSTDSINDISDAVLVFTVTYANAAPTIEADQVFSIPENSPAGAAVGTVSANDPDTVAPYGTLSFAITGGNIGNAFQIDALTGAVTVATSAALDFETRSSFELSITVTDGGGLADTKVVTVHLTDVDEGPVLTGYLLQKGQAQRSFIRYIDLTFATATGLDALINSGKIRLTRYDLLSTKDTSGINLLSSAGASVALNGVVKHDAGSNQLKFDFGTNGVGGGANSLAGDGCYVLELDLNGDGVFETSKRFYRLLGDVNGDRKVDQTDIDLVKGQIGKPLNLAFDLNGDGKVDAADVLLAQRSKGRAIGNVLLDPNS